MSLKHKVCINVARPDGTKDAVLRGESGQLRSRFLSALLGRKVSVLVITPGDSVETVEIREIRSEGGQVGHEQNQAAAGCCG